MRAWVVIAVSAAIAMASGLYVVQRPAHPAYTTGDASGLATRALVLPAPKAGRIKHMAVVLADNAGTETTDFVIPYAVLKESGAVDAVSVSTGQGTVKLMPALQVRADMTIEQFDSANPDGADILIVPAMHREDNPRVVDWVRAQSDKGATVVAICEGAGIIARVGLLEGKTATTHWYALGRFASAFPNTAWVRGRRYIPDGHVMTTAGVTASIPASLALVEAVAGRSLADATAKRLGLAEWGAAHSTAPFVLTAGRIAIAVRNWLSVWQHEIVGIAVKNNFDEIALALTADAWSRTYRSQAIAIHEHGIVRSRHGLVLEPDAYTRPSHNVGTAGSGPPAAALDQALDDIAARYGRATAGLVALQLEYPWR